MRDQPQSLDLFSYQVGFGDCFLLRFNYASSKRSVLIDFGTTGLPAAAERDQLTQVASKIAEHCEGKLAAVVATHRHADHISGFATDKHGKGPGAIIAALEPKVVIQPWTEHPDLATNAQALPRSIAHKKALGFGKALETMHWVAGRAVEVAARPGLGFSAGVRDQLSFIGQDNLKNASAVANLMKMAPNKYVHFGADAGLGRLLPGVKVSVWGPPTIKQSAAVQKQRARDADEFWHLHSLAMKASGGDEFSEDFPFPAAEFIRGTKLPASTRWMASRLRETKGDQLLQLVRILDKQLNNTSVILLFEVGAKKLLFPGDAQIENWQYALGKKSVQALLRDVDLYKVGHHGSLNATPKSMWARLAKKGPKTKRGRLTTVMSTLPGKHGKEEKRTEVPRQTLRRELESQSHLHSTDELASGALFEVIHIAVA